MTQQQMLAMCLSFLHISSAVQLDPLPLKRSDESGLFSDFQVLVFLSFKTAFDLVVQKQKIQLV